VETKKDFYEIHGYKTTSKLPSLKKLNEDRQLSIYALGVINKYPHVKNIDLLWHFLAFDQEIKKNEDILNKKKKEMMKLIDQIEDTKEFESVPSVLCQWCEYKQLCKNQPRKKNKQIKLKIS
jgi:putative RecB family exonuclease